MRPLALLLLACIAESGSAQVTTAPTPAPAQIYASGSGTVRLRPDRVTITIGVITRATSAADAASANAERMTPLLAALRRAGIPDSAIATSGFSVGLDQRFYGNTTPDEAERTYVASNTVLIALTNVDAVGALLDTALASGATQIGGIQYFSSREAEGRREATAIAVREARLMAEAAATAAGGSLGALRELNVSDRGATSQMNVLTATRVSPNSVSVLAADVNQTVSVQVRFAFIPGGGAEPRD
jgi:uncharacterized protein YggE